MKTNILVLLTLSLSLMSSVITASPTLTISGGSSPWASDASIIELEDRGQVSGASEVFSVLAGGSLGNLATVIDLNIVTGDYSSLGIRVFDDFLAINDTRNTSLLDTYFLLNTVDDVIKSSSSIGQSLRVDTHLQAIIDGVDQGSFAFRWELSHNGITGSYSVSTLPFEPGSSIQAVPVPAAAWLFGPSLVGLVSFSRRKKALKA